MSDRSFRHCPISVWQPGMCRAGVIPLSIAPDFEPGRHLSGPDPFAWLCTVPMHTPSRKRRITFARSRRQLRCCRLDLGQPRPGGSDPPPERGGKATDGRCSSVRCSRRRARAGKAWQGAIPSPGGSDPVPWHRPRYWARQRAATDPRPAPDDPQGRTAPRVRGRGPGAYAPASAARRCAQSPAAGAPRPPPPPRRAVCRRRGGWSGRQG